MLMCQPITLLAIHNLAYDTCLDAEFRPQLLHEKLAAAEAGASKTEMLYSLIQRLDGFKDMSRDTLWQVVMSATYESYDNGEVGRLICLSRCLHCICMRLGFIVVVWQLIMCLNGWLYLCADCVQRWQQII
jgi:hypothetical protein